MNFTVAYPVDYAEPVSLSMAKLHLRVSGDDEDDLISSIITASREWCEAFQNRAFASQTLTVYMDNLPDTIELPRLPIKTVTSIKYLDLNGVQQTLSGSLYQVDAVSGRITPAYSESWPSVRKTLNAVEIAYEAGYVTVPKSVIHAMLLLIGHLYENRELVTVGVTSSEMPFAVQSLLSPHRRHLV